MQWFPLKKKKKAKLIYCWTHLLRKCIKSILDSMKKGIDKHFQILFSEH